MNTNIVEYKKEAGDALWNTLKNSIYPGAKDESIIAVLQYCKSTNLDPMLKPVHITNMAGRDIIMPGIGFQRIIAARSGVYAGLSEPVYGANITEEFIDDKKKVSCTFPEWCMITVKKIVGGSIVEFTAKEYWRENYATVGRGSMPNMMWLKRPYGQLAKCAEAQALRKAFPELLGGVITHEEMEGKTFENMPVINSEPPKPESLNDHTYLIDNQRISAQAVHDIIMDKIDAINSEVDVEMFNAWKLINPELRKYAMNHKKLCDEYTEIVSMKRVKFLKKEEGRDVDDQEDMEE